MSAQDYERMIAPVLVKSELAKDSESFSQALIGQSSFDIKILKKNNGVVLRTSRKSFDTYFKKRNAKPGQKEGYSFFGWKCSIKPNF